MVGLHFFNPAQVMTLVEVVSTVSTSAATAAAALDVCGRLGKHRGRCADRAGFIVNALLFPTSTMRCGWCRRTTRPPTTSMPR